MVSSSALGIRPTLYYYSCSIFIHKFSYSPLCVMSQLATFSRQVEASKGVFEKLLSEVVDASNAPALAEYYSSLQKLLSQLENELIPTNEKIRQKLNQVDPVTGTKRYGAQAEQKFTASEEVLQSITAALRNHIAKHEAEYMTAKHAVEEEKERLQKAKLEALPAPVMSKITIERFGPSSEEEQTTAENDELHQKAEDLRVKKQQEMDDLRLLEKKMDKYLGNTYAQQLNNEFFCCDVATVIHAIKAHSAYIFSDWKAMKSLLLDILHRIVSKPDDTNIRKLRATHPTIQSKVTGKLGGIPLLLALGFQLVVKKDHVTSEVLPITARVAATEPVLGDYLSHHPLRVQWFKQHRSEWEILIAGPQSINNDLSYWLYAENLAKNHEKICNISHQDKIMQDYFSFIFPLCNNSPTSPWELFLEMEEPPIDDMLAPPPSAAVSSTSHTEEPKSKHIKVQLTWIDWYDRLQASIAILEQS